MTAKRPKCGGKTRAGGQCQRPAGWGTEHPGFGTCKLHLGSTQSHTRAAQKESAKQGCETLGLTIELDPGEALVRELWETAGNVAFYRALVQELATHPGQYEFHPPQGDEDGGWWERGETGVYGRTYHVSGVPTGEAKPHVLVALYNEERKHLTAVASAALKAGVEERRVKIAEDQATMLATAIRGILTDLGVADREDAPAIVRRHLTLISGGMAA